MVGEVQINSIQGLELFFKSNKAFLSQVIATRTFLRIFPMIVDKKDALLFDLESQRIILNNFRAAVISFSAISSSSDDKSRIAANRAGRFNHNPVSKYVLKTAGRSNARRDAVLAISYASQCVIDDNYNVFWGDVSRDCEYFESINRSNKHIFVDTPLFHDGVYSGVLASWRNFLNSNDFLIYKFHHFVKWYEEMAPMEYGESPSNYFGDELLLKISLQPDEWWARGAVPVNEDIDRWVREHSIHAIPQRRLPPKPVETELPLSSSRDEIKKVTASGSIKKIRSTSPKFTVLAHNIARNRFKFLVDDSRATEQAVFSGITGVRVVGGSSRLRFITVAKDHDTPDDVFFAGLEQMRARTGGRMTPEFRYDAESDLEFDPLFSDAMAEGDGLRPRATLNDVLARIGAQNLIYPRRNSVVIAVVDSGVDGARPEFRPADKRAGGWAEDPYDPWKDSRGHGTMCAVIAAGAGGDGGGFQGVAPLTPVMSCRAPGLVDGDLALIYDRLADMAADGITVVASNSYGWHTATTPELPDGEKFSEALNNAIAAGVHVVFSAGNNHSKTGAGPTVCTPNTIWQYKGLADVMTVGTCDLEGNMWGYSSRGPGQFPKQPGHGPKPDVVAPTPRMGLIAHGSRNIVAPNGWGTSGAAPQVAGLLAVLASTRPEAPRADLFDIIRQTAASLGHDKKCQGHGMIDCQAAVAMLTSKIW